MRVKKRLLSLLLCCTMVFSLCPQTISAAGIQSSRKAIGGLCEHHPAHDENCGYTEGTPGTPCRHEHAEDCYILVEKCVHKHTEECYPEEDVSDDTASPSDGDKAEPSECGHECSEESGCIKEKLDCQHEHDEDCGYAPAVKGTPCTYICGICNSQDSGQPEEKPLPDEDECICTERCTEKDINAGCPVCGGEDADLALCEGAERATSSNADELSAEDVQKLINELPTADELAAMDEEEQQEVYEKLQAAYEAYNALTDEQKAEVTGAEIFDSLFAMFNGMANALKNEAYYDISDGTIQIERCQGVCSGHTITGNSGDNRNMKNRIEVLEGYHRITLKDVSIYSRKGIGQSVENFCPITIYEGADVTLVLEGDNDLTSGRTEAGIRVPMGATLRIEGDGDLGIFSNGNAACIGGSTQDEKSGTIIINGGDFWLQNEGPFAPGIGGRNYTDITINGGDFYIKGGDYGAGIGGAGVNLVSASGENDGSITITGGTIQAYGGQRAAGIGGGAYQDGGNITIKGGDVTASGSRGGAGIGGGGDFSQESEYKAFGAGGNITISGGTVNASGDDRYGAVGIGGAEGKSPNTFTTGSNGRALIVAEEGISDKSQQSQWRGIVIDGKNGNVYGNQTLSSDLSIYGGITLTVPEETYLTIPADVTLTLGREWYDEEDKLIVNGDIIGSGTLDGDGVLEGSGTIADTITNNLREKSAVEVSIYPSEPVYGSNITITANISKVTNTLTRAAAQNKVNFYLGTADNGTLLESVDVSSNTATLQVSLNDEKWTAGQHTITAEYGGSMALESKSGTASFTVIKADQAGQPGAPDKDTATANSITLQSQTGGQAGVEYGCTTAGGTAEDVSNWQAGPTFDNLASGTAYTVFARYAGNEYYKPSEPSAGTTIYTLPEITTTTENLPVGYVGVGYNATLEAAKADGVSVTWSLAGDTSLPAGLSLAADGTIKGKPTAPTDTPVTFTVQATINGNISNTKELSITVNKGTPASGELTVDGATGEKGAFIYGDTITISGTIKASDTRPVTNALTAPSENQAALFLGDKQLTEPVNVEKDGSFTIGYHTSDKNITPGEQPQEITVRYGGDSNLNDGAAGAVKITLKPKPVTAKASGTDKVYDGDANTDNLSLFVAGADLVNADDDVEVTPLTAAYDNEEAGTGKAITITDVEIGGIDAAFYQVSVPEDVTGSITKARQDTFTIDEVMKTYGDEPFALTASGGSGEGEITWSVPADNTVLRLDSAQAEIIGAGTVTVTAIKSGGNNYEDAVAQRDITIAQAKAPDITYPAAGGLTYGQKLSESALTGGSTEYGSFGWKSPDTVPPVKNSGYTVVFTPSGETVQNYEAISETEQIVEVAVEKASPKLILTPSALRRTGGGTVMLEVSGLPEGGTAEITCSDGNIKPEADENNAGTWKVLLPNRSQTYTFTAAYAGDENHNAANGGCQVVVTRRAAGGGFSDNSSSSADKDNPQAPTDGQTAPVTPGADGSASIDSSAVGNAINQAAAEAKENGSTSNGIAVTVPIQNAAGVQSLTITIPAQTLDKLVSEKVRRFDITTNGLPSFSFILDTLEMLDTQSQGGDLILRIIKTTADSDEAKAAIGTRPAYDISLAYIQNGREMPLTDWKGETVSVKLPYTPAAEEQTGKLYAAYVDGSGKVEWLTKSSYDAGQKAVIFEVAYFGVYGVGYKTTVPAFTDIDGHWAKEHILFTVSRGLFSGTSETTFSPDTTLTRGMFVTALGRLAGINPSDHQTGIFADVKADAYYAPYVNWAAETGIASGTSAAAFEPDSGITREQMAVVMKNYADKMGYTIPKTRKAVTFADNGKISTGAKEAVTAMQQVGVLSGKSDNRFDPLGSTTRAEAAAVLHRFVGIIIDPQAANGWSQNDSGEWNFYHGGKPVTGWLYDGLKWYWLDNSGRMFTGGWKQIGGKWYYFFADGSMAANTTVEGYQVDADGVRITE